MESLHRELPGLGSEQQERGEEEEEGVANVMYHQHTHF